MSFDARRQRWRARPPTAADGPRPSAYFETRAEAEAWLADYLARRATADAPFDPSRTVGAYLRYWYGLGVRRWKPNQQTKVRSQINVCRPIAHHALERLTADHIDVLLSAISARGCGAGYVREIGRLLYRALAWAVRRKILAENVAEAVELPSAVRKRPQAWTLAEIRRLTAAARGERFEAAYLLFLHAGCRLGEVLAMPWTAVRDDEDVVAVEQAEYTAAGREIGTTKYGSDGGVDVAAPIMRRLRELKAAATTMYVLGKPAELRAHDRKRKGGEERWSPTTVARDWAALVKRAGVRPLLKTHAGRHSFASGHMAAGTDLADIADLLRHKSPAVTAAVYLSGNARRRRAAADRLGALVAPLDAGAQEQTS